VSNPGDAGHDGNTREESPERVQQNSGRVEGESSEASPGETPETRPGESSGTSPGEEAGSRGDTDSDPVTGLADVDTNPGAELADTEVDPELRTMFWKLVVLYKLAIIGTTLGVLLLVFDRGPAVGPELLGGSVVLLAYTLYLTKRGKERIDAGEFHDSDDGGTDAADAD
jgi:hypothetical protein